MHSDNPAQLAARIALLEDLLISVINMSKVEIQLTSRDLLQRRKAESLAGQPADKFPSALDDAERGAEMGRYLDQLLGKLDMPALTPNS